MNEAKYAIRGYTNSQGGIERESFADTMKEAKSKGERVHQ